MRPAITNRCMECEGQLTRDEILYNDYTCTRCDERRLAEAEIRRKKELEEAVLPAAPGVGDDR